ncbi:MAG: hypothetical protein U0805_19085 [Pirellulales bacterium]
MTTKQKIFATLETLDEDTSIDQAIDRLYLLRKIEIGRQQIAAGEFIDHDDFMRELEAEDQE